MEKYVKICGKPQQIWFYYIRKDSVKYYKNIGQFIMAWDTINQEDIKYKCPCLIMTSQIHKVKSGSYLKF